MQRLAVTATFSAAGAVEEFLLLVVADSPQQSLARQSAPRCRARWSLAAQGERVTLSAGIAIAGGD